jgi:hypothetical protein
MAASEDVSVKYLTGCRSCAPPGTNGFWFSQGVDTGPRRPLWRARRRDPDGRKAENAMSIVSLPAKGKSLKGRALDCEIKV